jgi:biotin operon repressor
MIPALSTIDDLPRLSKATVRALQKVGCEIESNQASHHRYSQAEVRVFPAEIDSQH